MRQVDMIRLDLLTKTLTETQDYVAIEVPLKILINDTYSFVIWCSPSQFKELTIGYLFAEEILHTIDEIQHITIDETENLCKINLNPNINLTHRMENRQQKTRIVPLIKNNTASYQQDNKLVIVNTDLTVKAQTIMDAIYQMNEKATGFKETGGLHVSGIFNADGTLLAFSEDVGRHNTVDKVIGKGLLSNINFTQSFIIITGRIPGDMIYKTAKAGIPIVTSITAVLNSGISSAQKANITLAGFARENRLNIYTHPKRILL